MFCLIGDKRMRAAFERLKKLPDGKQVPTILRWVTRRNSDLRLLALQILRLIGRESVQLLISNALAPGRRVEQRLLYLDALLEISLPLDGPQWVMLGSVAASQDLRVGLKIAQVLTSLRPVA